ncbi:MAG: response regulator [Candidatus Pacebacteria bacterium]|nr:response regulator [Candidatus Paceibacterota bacterium]
MTDSEKNKKIIMLVDDDTFLLDMYSLKFKNSGYEIITVNNPEEAVERLKSGDNPDIVLFDLVMSGIGGWGFIQAVRENKLAENAIFMVLSNQGQQIDFDTAKKYNVDGYVVKALSTPSEVLTEVEKVYKEKKS